MKLEYKTIKKEGMAEYIEKKSRFIAYIRRVEFEEEALLFIEAIRAKYKDASHHVYAYKIDNEQGFSRYNDDGEPGGTAGLPVFQVIKQNQIENVVIVIVRYFGGILLGAPGLIRAYSKTAMLGLDDCCIIIRRLCLEVCFEIEYSLLGKIQNLFHEEKIIIKEFVYSDVVHAHIYLQIDKVDEIKNKIVNVTSGNIFMTDISKQYIDVELIENNEK